MTDPTLDPSIFLTAMKDGMRIARIKLWVGFIGGTVLAVVLTSAGLVVVFGAAVGIGRWLAGF
jgi:hypothetical protein